MTPSLVSVAEHVRSRFEEQRRILSFAEYINLVVEKPQRYLRDAAQYLRDCFEYYGSYTVQRPEGDMLRWRLFDGEFQSEKRVSLVGHEDVQNRVAQLLAHFVREGRPNRLVLLHGPNGSAKSTFVECLFRALEHYSAQEEGVLYTFSWVFPKGQGDKSIGFGGRGADGGRETYAYLGDHELEAKLPSELREHPLLLLPKEERAPWIDKVYGDAGVKAVVPRWLMDGQLGAKNRQIFEALLTSYRGNLERVLAHIQVERFYISRKYRTGAVTIGPEMAADAHERQVSMDLSKANLPASLSATTLFETFGELVDAEGGLIEYSDLLKRPLDAWKYLMTAIETGEVSLQMTTLPLNMVMIGSCNELHLNAFREHPEFNSFRGRAQLIRTPYLSNYLQEAMIYERQVIPQVRRHVAPHVIWMLGLWGVLTRLRRADPEQFENKQLGHIAASLSPLEKAELYASGKIPSRLTSEEAVTLRHNIALVKKASSRGDIYEGSVGASPRELRTLLLDTAEDPNHEDVSPLSLLEHIERFCERQDYDFLKETPSFGYSDARGFIGQVRSRWLDAVDQALKEATGLVEEKEYREHFNRYVTHVSFWTKKERIYNKTRDIYEDPDAELMQSFETIFGASEKAEEFRGQLISRVAAHAIDHPGTEMNYGEIFPKLLEQVKEHYYRERHTVIGDIGKRILIELSSQDGSTNGYQLEMNPERVAQARATMARLLSEKGYQRSSLRDALSVLLHERYD